MHTVNAMNLLNQIKKTNSKKKDLYFKNYVFRRVKFVKIIQLSTWNSNVNYSETLRPSGLRYHE